MKFERGCNATDIPKLEAASLKLEEVAELVSTVFCSQIYLHGFVHCDPHAANVLIRPLGSEDGSKGHEGAGHARKPQLVLLDHGLYKELTPEFRLEYARLWQALVLADVPNITACCKRMNAGHLAPLLAAMLTNKPWNDITDKNITSLRQEGTSAEKVMIRGYAQRYMREITEVLNRVPRQMLLLFKANDCLRHIDRALGAPVNTFCITALHCAEALWEAEIGEKGFWHLATRAPRRAYRALSQYLQVIFRIRIYQLTLRFRASSQQPDQPSLAP